MSKKVLHAMVKMGKRLAHPIRRRLYIYDYVTPMEGVVRSWAPYLAKGYIEHGKSRALEDVRVLAPEEQVHFGTPGKDPFFPLGKYHRDGSFARAPIVTCKLPAARLHVGTGMVCTRDWETVLDMPNHLDHYPLFRKRRPLRVQRLAGNFTAIYRFNADNLSHWLIDCLTRLHSLVRAGVTGPVTVIMPDSASAVHRESLEYVLPPGFTAQYWPNHTWLELENFFWPSVVSARWNFHLPAEYYESVRGPILSRLHIPRRPEKPTRLYIRRRKAKIRRVSNEDELCECLKRYGFEAVDLEERSFREQVELFARADTIIGPHGAGLVWVLFADKFSLIELHPTQLLRNHFHTLVNGLGQNYHFLYQAVEHNGDNDFQIHWQDLECLLREKLGLQPID